MRLADALNLPWEEAFEEGSPESIDLYTKLVEGALDYLTAGGSITLVDWCGFTPTEREACIDAANKRNAVIAASIGIAAQGAHAEIYSLADGGDLLIKDTLNSVIEEMESSG